MLVVHPIGLGQAGYYQHEPGTAQWRGHGSESLELPAEVDTASLRAVLAGREPGGELLLRRIPAQRRAGFDLIFAAPKSVSLLGELAPPAVAPRFQVAHRRAVDAAIGYLERQATWTRRGQDGKQVPIPTTGLVAAAYLHHWSGAADPHLHTHLVVANLVQGHDGVWSCLDSRALFHHAGAAGAIFQAALRHALAEQGLGFAWHIQQNGLADVAAVPRVAIDACSLRHRQVTAEILAGVAGTAERATAAGRTRGRAAPEAIAPWQARAARAGLDRGVAAEMVAAAGQRQLTPAVAPETKVTERALAEQRSRFQRQDVVQVVARLTVPGAHAEVLERWADDYLATAIRTGARAWTTPGLRQMEERVATLAATAMSRSSSGLAGPGVVESVLSERPDLTETGRDAARRLTTSGAGIERLAGGDFVSQAFVLDAARSAWEASGHHVAMVCRDQRSAARWQAMTALGPPPPRPAHTTVVAVDGADRCSTAELHRILSDGVARNAKVVLIDGGTNPARRQAASPAMEALRAALPGLQCGRAGPEAALAPAGPVVRAGRDAAVTITHDGPTAASQLIAEWQHARTHPGPGIPTMVALGPDEAEYLNAAARILLSRSGVLAGPTITAGRHQFQAGDVVRALRRDARLGAARAGTVGIVTAVDPERSRVTIGWPSGDISLAAAQLARAPLTHAYATTPAYLRGAKQGPVLCLGDPSTIAPRLAPDRIAQVLTIDGTHRHREPDRLVGSEQQPRRPTLVPPDEASRSLADLRRERDQLAGQLRAEVPSDPGPELRRVAEQRDALMLRRHVPGVDNRLAELNMRYSELSSAAQVRARWTEEHRPELVRFDHVTAAIAWRENALGRAAEIRPTPAVLDQLGPPPPNDAERRVWRDAAGAIEAYRERWNVGDQPLTLRRQTLEPPTPDQDPARRLDEQRIVDATRALEHSRGVDRGLGL